jgi:MYXO-CTERM domain-containing protein
MNLVSVVLRFGVYWTPIALALCLACKENDWAPSNIELVESTERAAMLSPAGALDLPLPSNGYGRPLEPTVAYNGTNYLVAWVDPDRVPFGNQAVFAARVAPGGAVLDTSGIPVHTSSLAHQGVAAASDGTEFLVVWEEPATIRAALVTGAGVVLSSVALVTGNFNLQARPTIAFGGGTYFVAWRQTVGSDQGEIYGARVSTTGAVLDAGGLAVGLAAGVQETPAATFNGQNFLVVWRDVTDQYVYGARVSTAGGLLDPVPHLIAQTDAKGGPALAGGPGHSLAAWPAGSSNDAIYAVRIETTGQPAGLPTTIVTATNDERDPTVVWTGSQYRVFWTRTVAGSSKRVVGATLSAAAALVGPVGLAVSGVDANGQDRMMPAAAASSNEALVTWISESGPRQVKGTRLDGSGTVIDSIPLDIDRSANNQRWPFIASAGSGFLVTWNDFRNGQNEDIYGVRLGSNGTPLDSPAIAIATGANDQQYAATASNGTDYLVTYLRSGFPGRGTYATRVTAAGQVLDPAGITIAVNQGYQDGVVLAFDGTNYVVAFEQIDDGQPDPSRICVQRVSPAGSLVGGLITLAGPQGNFAAPSIACGALNCLVVWSDTMSPPSDVHGRRIDSNGNLLDSQPLLIQTNAVLPAAVSDGTDYLVTWLEAVDPSTTKVWARRVSGAGQLLGAGPIAIPTVPSMSVFVQGVFDGKNYVLAFINANGLTSEGLIGVDIQGVRVSSSGEVRSPGVFDISNDPLAVDWGVDIAVNNAGKLMAVFARYDGSSAVRASRIYSVELSWSPLGSPCSANHECDSGHCVDGVCCDGPCVGGLTTDCQACAVAAGAQSNGTCGPIADGTSCVQGTCQGGLCVAPPPDAALAVDSSVQNDSGSPDGGIAAPDGNSPSADLGLPSDAIPPGDQPQGEAVPTTDAAADVVDPLGGDQAGKADGIPTLDSTASSLDAFGTSELGLKQTDAVAGCSCQTGGSPSSAGGLWLLAGLTLVILVRRQVARGQAKARGR